MDSAVLQLLSDFGAKHQGLLRGPAQHSRKQGNRQTLESGVDVMEGPGSDLLVERVARPAVQRPLELLSRYVDEPSLLEPAFEVGAFDHGAAGLGSSVLEENADLVEVAILGHRAVVAPVGDTRFLQFEVAAGLEVAGETLVSD